MKKLLESLKIKFDRAIESIVFNERIARQLSRTEWNMTNC